MTARSVLRGLGYMLKEVEAFVPWQAWRCALGTDFAWRQSQAAYAHDAMVGLDEFEEANEVHEPRAQCKWCANVDTPGHACGRRYHEVLSSAASASAGDGSAEGEPPTPSPSAEHPPTSPFMELVAQWRTRSDWRSDWHSARELRRAADELEALCHRLESEQLASGEDMGARVEATAAVFPQHQK